MTGPVTLSELRGVDLFDGIDDDQLAEWLAMAQLHEVAPGELIVEEQAHVPGLILLLEGTALTQLTSRGGPEPMGRQRAPTWIGAISVLTEDPLPVRIVAESACRLAIIAPDEFLRLLFTQRPVHQTVIRRISPVLQRLGGIEQNRDWPRWGRWRRASRTSSTTRRRPPAARPRSSPRRSRSCSRRS